MKALLLFLLVFLNLYNPVSIYITIIIDVIFFLVIKKTRKKEIPSRNIVVLSILIFMWAVVAVCVNFTYDEYVLSKYAKMFLSTYLLCNIIQNFDVSPRVFMNTISLVLLSHVSAVILQMFFPSLIYPMANFFSFSREYVLEDRYFRLLGFGGSYDSAALISMSSMSLFFLRYISERKIIFLLIAFISYFSTIRISRTGMLVGGVFFVMFLAYIFLKSNRKRKIYILLFSLIGIFVIRDYVIPILVYTSGLFDGYSSSEITNMNVGREYGSGSATSLLRGNHLNLLNLNFLYLIFGLGCDSSNLKGVATDIGYLEIISHIGFVGLILIIYMYIYMFKAVFRFKDESSKIIKNIRAFILVFIALIFIMNYKLLLMYGRGVHELLLILYFYYIHNQYIINEKNKYSNSMRNL